MRHPSSSIAVRVANAFCPVSPASAGMMMPPCGAMQANTRPLIGDTIQPPFVDIALSMGLYKGGGEIVYNGFSTQDPEEKVRGAVVKITEKVLQTMMTEWYFLRFLPGSAGIATFTEPSVAVSRPRSTPSRFTCSASVELLV